MPTIRAIVAGLDPPLTVSLPDDATLSDLSAHLFALQRPDMNPAKHRLRFIAAGKALAATAAATLTAAGLRDHSFVHVAVSELPPLPPPPPPPSPPPPPPPPPSSFPQLADPAPSMVTIDLHSASSLAQQQQQQHAHHVAPSLAPAPVPAPVPAPMADQLPVTVHAHAQGMMSPPYTPPRSPRAVVATHEVAQPLYFGRAVYLPMHGDEGSEDSTFSAIVERHAHYGSAGAGAGAGIGTATAAAAAAAARPVGDEDEDGSPCDWMSGFVLGLLLGLIMLVLSMDRSIALSRKWKKGIGCGALVNLAFGLYLLITDHST